jgi:NTE family protein
MSDESILPDPDSDRGYRRSPEAQEAFEAAAASLLATDPWTKVDGSRPEGPPELRADLALEGGGVKGIGLAGAILVLDEAGYKVQRVAGTSAGAIAAALVAALVQRGRPITDLRKQLESLQFDKFMPEGKLHRFLHHVGGTNEEVLSDAATLVNKIGLYPGTYLYDWMGPILKDLKIKTFSDLKITQASDPEMSLPEERRYRLVVHTSDITREQLARLPWDYDYYGKNRDQELVIDAVRASMSIPFFFEPVTFETDEAKIDLPAPDGTTVPLTYAAGSVTWVDGGMLRNFPINAFDRSDGAAPRWPTIGIKLSNLRTSFGSTEGCKHALGVGIHSLHTMMNEWDSYGVEQTTAARTIFVDNAGLKATDFDLSADQRQQLFLNGVAAATKFIIDKSKAGGVPRTAEQALKLDRPGSSHLASYT